MHFTLLQIKQYSYSHNGSKPHSWPENEKGSVQCSGENDDQLHLSSSIPFKLFIWSIGNTHYILLCIVEYSIVSLALSLVIVKFFPAIHNQIVSRVTRVEYQSLYWGTVIVSNIFIFLFLVGRAWSLKYFNLYFSKWIFCTVVTLEVVFNTICFVGALVASYTGHGGSGVPIPEGMAKNLIYISSFFCCCAGCSVNCKTKVLRILVLFSFMSFIYHSILDVISVTFLLFIEETRTSTVALILLYISLLVFLVLFVSFSLLLLIKHNVSGWHQCLHIFGRAFILIVVFGALMLLIALYMVIVFTLELRGLSGIVTGIIPSIVLSSISWYIKKKLFTEEHNTSSNMSQLPAENETIINGNENESTTLLP